MDTSDKDGQTFKIPAEYRHFAHGYVVTSYKSQGRTSDYEVIAAERLDAKSAYVACSRGRKSIDVFTPDKENLFRNLGTPVNRTAAYDVIDKTRTDLWRDDELNAHRQAVNDMALHHAFENDYENDISDEKDLDPVNDFTHTNTVNHANNSNFEHTNNITKTYTNDFSL